MSIVSSFPLSGAHEKDKLAIAALLFSIALHVLVLFFSLSQRMATTLAQRKDATSHLSITLGSSRIYGHLPKHGIVENGKELRTAPHSAGSPSSLRANPQHSSDHNVRANMSDNSGQEHSLGRTPKIDMDVAHEIARRFARESAGVTSQRSHLAQPMEDQETVLGKSIAKAARPDCRIVGLAQNSEIGGDFTISGEGLLAIPFLIKNALTESGCKW